MRLVTLVLALCAAAPAAAQSLSVADYRAAVLEYSFSLKEARQRSVQAGELAGKARTGLLPRLTAVGEFDLSFRREEHATERGPVRARPYAFDLRPTVVQTIYGGGAARNAWQQARVQSLGALCDEEFTALEVAYAAEYAYWNYSMNRAVVEAVSQYVELIEALGKVIENRFEEGYIGRSDVLMIETRLNDARYQLIEAEHNLGLSLHNFNVLMGADPDREPLLSEDIMDRDSMPVRMPLPEVLARRPDYQAAGLAAISERYAEKIVAAGYLPSLTGGVTGVWQNVSPNLRGETTVTGMAYLRVNIPIFMWGERRRSLGAARAATLRSEYAANRMRDEILQEETDAWTALVESYMQVTTSYNSLSLARENLDLSTFSYNEGLVPIVDVMTAQISWIQLFSNTINANYHLKLALAGYRRACGVRAD
ncbi:MAG: TolC family protein [Rikenellaceae bacterium]|nr:TolC family protein [Rikenellaceae bacterium]